MMKQYELSMNFWVETKHWRCCRFRGRRRSSKTQYRLAVDVRRKLVVTWPEIIARTAHASRSPKLHLGTTTLSRENKHVDSLWGHDQRTWSKNSSRENSMSHWSSQEEHQAEFAPVFVMTSNTILCSITVFCFVGGQFVDADTVEYNYQFTKIFI